MNLIKIVAGMFVAMAMIMGGANGCDGGNEMPAPPPPPPAGDGGN